jgi:hypothetical protein
MVAYKAENPFRLLLATDFDVLHCTSLCRLVKEWLNPIISFV